MTIVCIILAICVCLMGGVCFYIGSSARKAAADSSAEIHRLSTERSLAEERLAAEKKLSETRQENFDRSLEEVRQNAERRIAEIKEEHAARLFEEREAMAERFRAIASDILQSNSKQLDERSRTTIEAVLAPMKTRLEEFSKGFRECYDIENRDRLSLREEIKNLHELNTRVGNETARLAAALKGNTRIQGQWGEMVLRNILEHSGLEEGTWFVTQESSTSQSGTVLRPDAVIHCPGERDIIIDSKASLTSYLSMLEAEDECEQQRLIDAHVKSVENHIAVLRRKEYHEQVGAKKGDFVFMFMPHEGAYLAAMRAKPDLWLKAYDSHVIMVSPTHLVTVLRLVEQMWQTEKQTINSEKIAEEAAKLLESVQLFLTDMSSIGSSLEKADKAYQSAVRRLQTGNNNVVRVASRMKELGVKAKKDLPPQFTPAP